MFGFESYRRFIMRSRREAVRRQRITFISILFVAMFAIIGSIVFGVTKAQAAPAEPSYKYYTRRGIRFGILPMST